jgi:hypothetical protein
MRHNILHILILVILPFIGLTQGFYQDNYYFDLIKSGKTKVKVFKSELKSVWLIDSSARTLTQHMLEPTFMNPGAPIFENNRSTYYLKKYYFNKLGKIDSILLADYHTYVIRTGKNSRIDTIADTTVIIYSYPQLENWVMNEKFFQIKNGLRRLKRTDHYGYDDHKRLILHIEDEGRIQYYFTYNDKEQIVTCSYLGTKIKYEYNSSGRLQIWESVKNKIQYEYNQDNLLIKEVISGNKEQTTTYEYE